MDSKRKLIMGYSIQEFAEQFVKKEQKRAKDGLYGYLIGDDSEYKSLGGLERNSMDNEITQVLLDKRITRPKIN